MIKYFPGNIFVNTLTAAFSDMISSAASGLIYNSIGPKRSLMAFFGLSAFAGTCIVFYERTFDSSTEGQSYLIFPMLILMASFGIAASFNTIYIANSELFPVLFSSTAIGICNLIARLSSILCSQLAEVQSLLPMIVFTGLSLAAAVST